MAGDPRRSGRRRGRVPGDPTAAALKGLVRVLAYEHSDLRATLVDLDARRRRPGRVGGQSSASPTADDVIAWRSRRRLVERLSRADTCSPRRARSGGPPGCRVHRHAVVWAASAWSSHDGSSTRCRPRRAQRPQRADRRAAPGTVRPGGEGGDRRGHRRYRGSRGTPSDWWPPPRKPGVELRGIVHGAAVIDDSLLVSDEQGEPASGCGRPRPSARCGCTRPAPPVPWTGGSGSLPSLRFSARPARRRTRAASAWLDGLVAWRAAPGLPATAINWGPWSEVGVARSLAGSVLDPITPAEGIEALESLLATDRISDRRRAAAHRSRTGGVPGDAWARLLPAVSTNWTRPATTRRLGRCRCTSRPGSR